MIQGLLLRVCVLIQPPIFDFGIQFSSVPKDVLNENKFFLGFFVFFSIKKNVQFYSQRYLNGIQNEIKFLKQVKYVLISFLLSKILKKSFN